MDEQHDCRNVAAYICVEGLEINCYSNINVPSFSPGIARLGLISDIFGTCESEDPRRDDERILVDIEGRSFGSRHDPLAPQALRPHMTMHAASPSSQRKFRSRPMKSQEQVYKPRRRQHMWCISKPGSFVIEVIGGYRRLSEVILGYFLWDLVDNLG